MSQKWQELLVEIEKANPQDDSLELGDSWKAMPRRTEGVNNKTNALYRRSVQPQHQKNAYNFIIEKRPQPTVERQTKNSNSVNVAVATQKLLIPSVQPITSDRVDDNDSLNFSKYLSAKNNGATAMTSTPYPLRQIDCNKSPKRFFGNGQQRAADSPIKLFVPTPTRIPMITPRTSKIPNGSATCKLREDGKKMSSPVVSSTVNNISDEDEVQSDPVKSPGQQLTVRNDKLSLATVDEDQNCVPLDEDQQKHDAGVKPPDEDLFRRPQMVLPTYSLKSNMLDPDDETAADQSKLSKRPNRSQKNKKPNMKTNRLLESYIRVGESITNRTNGGPLENYSTSSSSSSSRRKLYRKGDSCNEDELLKGTEPVSNLDPVLVNENETFSTAKSTSVKLTADDFKFSDVTGNQKNTTVALEQTNLQLPVSESEQNDIDVVCEDDDAQLQCSLSNESKGSSNNVPSPHAPSSNEDSDTEKVRQEPNSADQQNFMSEKHSNKRVLEGIIEEWSDTGEPSHSDDDDHSDSSESERNSGRTHMKKQPITESKVRQVRSKDQKNQKQNARREKTRTNMEQIVNEVTSKEDKPSVNSSSQPLLPNKQNSIDTKKAKRIEKNASKKAIIEPVHSTQQHEVIENEYHHSDENEDIVEVPSNRHIKKPVTKNQQENIEEDQVQQPKSGRLKSRRIKNKTDGVNEELPATSQPNAKNKRSSVIDEVPESDKDKVELPTKSHKSRTNAKQKRLNVLDVVTETDKNEAELPTEKAQGKSQTKRMNVKDDNEAVGRSDAPSNTKGKTKKKRLNVEEHTIETNHGEEPAIDIDDTSAPYQTDDNAAQEKNDGKATTTRLATKKKARQSRKRKLESIVEDSLQPDDQNDNNPSRSNQSAMRKSKRPKWDKIGILKYDSMKPRDVAPGVRHSTRERRLPTNNLLLFNALPKTTSIRSTNLRKTSGNVAYKKVGRPSAPKRGDDNGEQDTIYSMLLNGSVDKEPPLITTRLSGIEISQGFHKTVKNNLVIHHKPGINGPSYGYLTLEPGMVKRSCRTSSNLQIHVVSGHIQIIKGDESEKMVTGSFATLQSGTKYSLRNDGENPALIFFSQHFSESNE